MPRWTVGDVSGSETLTDSDHLYKEHINELRTSLGQRGFNVKDYGATGDGSTDDTSAINDAITAASGDILLFPKGDYKITSTLTIPANTIVIGYGARLFNTTTNIDFLEIDSGCKVYGIEIEGTGYADLDGSAGSGIKLEGEVGSNKTNVIIQDCYIHDLEGHSAVYIEDAENVWVSNCRLMNQAYSGVLIMSGINVHVDKCHIKEITSSYINQYGVTISSWNAAENPRSERCWVTDCLIEDVTGWEGIDTHGGKGLRIEGNIIRGCKTGIVLKMRPSSGTTIDSATDCIVKGNIVYGGGSLGMYITGSGTGGVRAKNNIIEGNVFYDCGLEGGDYLEQGSILISYTDNTVIANNVCVNSYGSGIVLRRENYGASVTGNMISDSQNTTGNEGVGITVYEDTTAIITGNHVYKNDDTLNDVVCSIGYYIGGTGTDITLGSNNKATDCDTALSGTPTDYGQFGA